MNRKVWTAIFAALGMLMLILDTKTALNGAADGIQLCIRSVIPSLFPFFVLSRLLIPAVWGSRIFRPIGKLCRIPEGSEPLLIIGAICGYPVGARNVAQAWKEGWITQSDAQRLLQFCSNCGPAFLFGILSTQFGDPRVPWMLWGIHILSFLSVGILSPGIPSHAECRQNNPENMPSIIRNSTITMACVCAWIIMFRILIAFVQKWFGWIIPTDIFVIISGILEMTNGCCNLNQIQDPILRFVAASAIIAFGGLCVTMQTASVISGLGIRHYISGKLLQTLFSIVLAYSIITVHWQPPIFLAFLGIICREMKKRGSNPAAYGV